MTDERLESRGGARENAGRKAAPKGSRRRSMTVTDYEYDLHSELVKNAQRVTGRMTDGI